MLNLGMSEILLFAIIALIVLGPDKLPEAARFAGRWYGKLKRMINNVQHDIDRELRMSELREQMQQELARIQQLEEKMQAQMAQITQHDVLRTEQSTLKIQASEHLLHPEPKFKLCEAQQLKTPFIHNINPLINTTIDLKKAV